MTWEEASCGPAGWRSGCGGSMRGRVRGGPPKYWYWVAMEVGRRQRERELQEVGSEVLRVVNDDLRLGSATAQAGRINTTRHRKLGDAPHHCPQGERDLVRL